jgi:hypothetical protein
MANATTTVPNPQKVNNGIAPKEGRLTVPFNIDFTAISSYTVDLTAIQQMQQRISFVQSVFVDNSQSTVDLVLTLSTTQQRIIVPANSQAYLPMLLSLQNSLLVQSSSGIVIPLQFMNFAIAPCVWSTLNPLNGGTGGAIPVSDAALEATVANGAVQTQISGNVSYTNASGTIAAANTSQQLTAANPTIRHLILQNTGTAALWFNMTGSAAGVNVGASMELAAGAIYETPPGYCSNAQWNIFGGTSAQPFACLWT